MSRFAIQQIKLNNTLYPGVKGFQTSYGREVDTDATDGVVNETMHHLMATKPSADLETLNLKGILAALNDSTDLPQKAFDGTNGLVIYGAKSAGLGLAAGGSHLSRTMLRGLIHASSLSWSKNQKATLKLRAMGKSADGTTPCIGEAINATLPAAPTPDFGWALASLQIAGQTISAVDSIEETWDPKYDWEFIAGLPEPTDIIGAPIRGPLSVRLTADIGDCDLGSGSGATVLTFKRYINGGGFHATDLVTHTLNGVWSIEEGLSGNQGSSLSRRLNVLTRHDGTNRPWTGAIA